MQLLLIVILLLCIFVVNADAQETYDAIVVGAGAGGCPLAQTLATGGKRVLLLERGPERPPLAETKFTFSQVLLDPTCVETFSSKGVQVSTGKCMGGATSINQGIWIEEDPAWIKVEIEKVLGGHFQELTKIEEAFRWVTEQVAPTPTQETGSAAVHISAMAQAIQASTGLPFFNQGQSSIPNQDGTWRTHSIFDETGKRRPADTVLDRSNVNLTIRVNSTVERVVFDVDHTSNFWNWLFRRQTPVAECVQLVDGERLCVRSGGRIYLAAGAFRTPHLLFQSGIGPSLFGKIINFEVGNHLSDKPAFPLVGFFPNGFDYSGQVITSHLATIQTYEGRHNTRKLLFEEISAGVPAFFDGVAYERIFAPSILRSLFIANDIVDRILQCSDEVLAGVDPVSSECKVFQPIVDANCHTSFTILASMVANPSSTGRVVLGLGRDPIVNVNYLSTIGDVEALGAAIRTGYEIMTNLTGPSELQRPCDERATEECSMSCPDLTKILETELGGFVGMLLPSYPVSTLFPFSAESHISKHANSNLALGSAEVLTIFSPHHFAGTARVGSVLDRNFRVGGTENLYVADASALPKTPRVNAMASAMMMGRLAGVVALEEEW